MQLPTHGIVLTQSISQSSIKKLASRLDSEIRALSTSEGTRRVSK